MHDYIVLKRRYAIVSLLREYALLKEAGISGKEALETAARDCMDKETGSQIMNSIKDSTAQSYLDHVAVVMDDCPELFPEFVRTVIIKDAPPAVLAKSADILNERIHFLS